VFVPKYRKRTIFGELRRQIGGILRDLCVQHDIELVEGHAMLDHVHLLLSIPPTFSIANTVGFVKGKSAIQIHRRFLGRQRSFTGFHFWARGYCVSTVGLDEDKVRKYIQEQEEEEKRQEELPFGGLQPPSSGKPRA
jgi:putative transposase